MSEINPQFAWIERAEEDFLIAKNVWRFARGLLELK